ncbi:hypothetical protein [Fusobacterium ulcerans]|uniref:hypothetical protein n=1 Tax=Fusobacterium ulcerans TaxID=861 RepID=UPI001559C6F0|nr:hypothetical protein [Fusobacterium ulcerans]
MIYLCRKCRRFLANIKTEKNLYLKGKSIIVQGEGIEITCKCGEKTLISLANNKKE